MYRIFAFTGFFKLKYYNTITYKTRITIAPFIYLHHVLFNKLQLKNLKLKNNIFSKYKNMIT